MFPLVLMAQNFQEDGGKYEVYCDVRDYEISVKSSQITIRINNTKYNIVDKDGNIVKCNEITEALNLLSKRGWRLVSSFGYDCGGDTFKHYTMKKEVVSDEDINTGLKPYK